MSAFVFSRVPVGLVLALMVAGLAACNTVEGVGRDVSATGDAIEDAAEEAKE